MYLIIESKGAVKPTTKEQAMTTYQFSKTNIISADRNQRSLEGKFQGQFLVATSPISTDGSREIEPLENRGYVFGGKNMSVIGRMWFKPFSSEEEAEMEIEALCETGI